MQNNTSVTMLDTSLIIPNKYQPRKVFEDNALNSLAESIKNYGIINPILVRKKDNKYEIIAGERRFRAAKQIGLTEVPVIVKNADEQQMAELALIENIQRQGLSPIEEAKSYEEIMRIGNHTQAGLAKKLGKSQSAIANKIRLLSLPQEIQDALANKKISERHARSLISITEQEKQLELLNRIIAEKLTVKETEEIIKENTINDDEIKTAISDILKSLNIKEEEKEDDNMNNGNFFPNFDNNNNSNNNTSLNMMNLQSLNQPPMQPAPEVVMPTAMPEQNIQAIQIQGQPIDVTMNPQPMVNQFVPNTINEQNQNLEMNNNINPIPDFMLPQENQVVQPINNIEQPMINNTPLFGAAPVMEQNNMVPESTNSVSQPQIETPMIDIPLFNPNVSMTPQEPQIPTMETPELTITNPETIPVMEQNNIDQAPIQVTDSTNSVSQPQIETPMIDIPLFNPNITIPGTESTVENLPIVEQPIIEQPPVDPTPIEIPVNTPITVEQVNTENSVIEVPLVVDRLMQLQDLLTANGFVFKTFSNETDNCIIIEIPKN